MTSTERPRTPPRSSYISDSTTFSKTSQDSQPFLSFEPHVFDLIHPIREATSLLTKYIPSVFKEAEAVDSSTLLGHGASFSASLLRIPDGPKTVQHTTNMGGLEITSSSPAPQRPKYVVYKVARVAFDGKGNPLPEYRRAMQSVLTELHALIYPPLFKHSNIINFLGFAWGSNPFSSSQRLPAIMVEYAEHGTLADLVKDSKVDFTTKHMLCLDIARGLSALHLAGLAHGDVKAENVLICSSVNRTYVAKIADFGYSVVQATESEEIWIGGTKPWMAPENSKGAVKVGDLPKTDIYSYGLLCWFTCVDGGHLLKLLAHSEDETMTNDEFERHKIEDSLLKLANDEEWFNRYAHVKCDDRIHIALEAATAALRANGDSSNAYLKLLQEHTENLRSNLFARLSGQMRQEKLVRHLKTIFENSIQLDITKRDLRSIISILESDVDVPNSKTPNPNTQTASQKTYTSTNHSNLGTGSAPKGEGTSTSSSTLDLVNVGSKSPAAEPAAGFSLGAKESSSGESSNITSWRQRGYKFHWYSWGKIRDLDPSVQNFAYEAFTDNVGPDLFVLTALHVNGYGCEINIEKSLQYLRHAARLGHYNSQKYMWRIFSSLSTSNSEIHGDEYLFNYAVNGSRTALEDLQIAQGPEKYRLARGWLTDAYCGVGSWWLKDDEMLNGWTQSNLRDHEWCVKRQAENSTKSSELIINKRGDTLLHGTAVCGEWMPFKSLVLEFKLEINTRNCLGETPLLSACRAGQGAVAILCLQRYDADASIIAKNGETPLHWLVSFTDENIEPLTKDLISHGAVVDASTHERINYSAVPSDLDVDIQLPGTALKWAVHNNRPHIVRTLLAYGADPHWTSDGAIQSPVKWAAYYHHDECLRAIIEFLEGKVTQMTTEGKKDLRFAITYGPLVIQAVYAADKFSMILRNGPQYLTRLHATLDLLREKTKMINFSSSFNGSMLYYAVSEAHDEVVEYMFKHSWCTETLNTPSGNAKRTPLLEAVRWNRSSLVNLLLGYGANVRALASNPFQPDQMNWSALHIFAHEGHNKNLDLVRALVENSVLVDGAEYTQPVAPPNAPSTNQTAETVDISPLSLTKTSPQIMTCETPFAVALRHNAFNLATVLLQAGADPNALTLSSGLFISPYPLTTLGHMIISNARYSSPRLRYLLNISTPACAFIVEPARLLTALHRAAMAHQEIVKVEGGEVTTQEFDVETNADIMYELLLKWQGRDELNAKCKIRGNTALHVAVEAANSRAVEALLMAGARRDVVNEEGKTALEIAETMAEKKVKYAALLKILQG